MEIDEMLKELGQWGRYQLLICLLVVYPLMMCGYLKSEYIFTTMDVPHRCRIPECEAASGNVEFLPAWLDQAVPFMEEHKPEKCQRFQPRQNGSFSTTNCSAEIFDTEVIVNCKDWVFEKSTYTLIHEFNLMCPEDEMKISNIGSSPMVTEFISTPMAGLIADRFGRTPVFALSCFMAGMGVLVRTFLTDYDTFICFQLFMGLFGSIYTIIYTNVMEMLAPKSRVWGSLFVNICFCLGEMSAGLVMWWVQDWRLFGLFSVPMIGILSYIWLLPESVRWLYTQKRYKEVEKILSNIAKTNRTTEKLPSILTHLHTVASNINLSSDGEDKSTSIGYFRITQVLKSKILMYRVVSLIVVILAIVYTDSGLSLDSAIIPGNHYWNFIAVSFIEIPAFIANLWIPENRVLGRRWATAGSFFISGTTCWAFLLADKETGIEMWHYMLFLLSKFCTTVTLCNIYLHATELFPTEFRLTLVAICFTFGHGSLLFVPQIPWLAELVDPMLVFGLLSWMGGALALTFPETLHTKLPDTIQEAENIGRTSKHKQLSG